MELQRSPCDRREGEWYQITRGSEVRAAFYLDEFPNEETDANFRTSDLAYTAVCGGPAVGWGTVLRQNSLSSWLALPMSSLLAWPFASCHCLIIWGRVGGAEARLGNEHGELSPFRFGGEDATFATPSAHYLAAPLLALLLFAH